MSDGSIGDSPIYICRGINPTYAAIVRARGCRKYRIIGKWTKSRRLAFRTLMTTMLDDRWKRGIVLYRADYYDPTPILRVNR